MASISTFLLVYLIGGLTFIPLLLLLALVTLYFNYTIDPANRPSKPHFPAPKAAETSTKLNDDTDGTKNKYYKVGWVRVTREYRPGGLEAPHISGMVMQGIQSYMQGKNAPQRRPKDSCFAVLKYNTLFLYESDKQLDCRAVITMNLHSVSIYPPYLEEHELFSRPNAVRLTKKESILDGDGSLLADATRSQSDYFLFCDRSIDKEDWYFALIRASKLASTSPGAPQDLGPVDSTHFDQTAMNQLIQLIHSDEAHFHTQWLNALLGRVFFAIYRTDLLRTFIFNKVVKKAKKIKRPGFLGEIIVRSVDIGQSLPYVMNPRLLGLTPAGELTAEGDVQYNGGFRLEIETEAAWQYSRIGAIKVHLVLAVMLKRIKGKVLLRIKGPPSNRVWIGFYEPPQMEWSIEPVVSDKQVKFSMITNAIEARIREMMNENMVLPNMDDFPFFPTQSAGGIFGGDVVEPEEPAKEPAKVPANWGEVAQETEEEKSGREAVIEDEDGSVNGSEKDKENSKKSDKQANGNGTNEGERERVGSPSSGSDKEVAAPDSTDLPSRTLSSKSLLPPKPVPPKLPPRRARSEKSLPVPNLQPLPASLSSPDGFIYPSESDPPITVAPIPDLLNAHPDTLPTYDYSDTASILSVASTASSSSTTKGRWLRRRREVLPTTTIPSLPVSPPDPDVLTAQNTLANALTKRNTIIGMAGTLLARGKELKNSAAERSASYRLSLSGSDHSGDEGQLAHPSSSPPGSSSSGSLVGQSTIAVAATATTTAVAAAAAVVSAAKPLIAQRRGWLRRNTTSSAQGEESAQEGVMPGPVVVKPSLSSPVLLGKGGSEPLSGEEEEVEEGEAREVQIEKIMREREADVVAVEVEANSKLVEPVETVVPVEVVEENATAIPMANETLELEASTPASSSTSSLAPELLLPESEASLQARPPKPPRLRSKSSASTSITTVNVTMPVAAARAEEGLVAPTPELIVKSESEQAEVVISEPGQAEVVPMEEGSEGGGFEVETLVLETDGEAEAKLKTEEEVRVDAKTLEETEAEVETRVEATEAAYEFEVPESMEDSDFAMGTPLNGELEMESLPPSPPLADPLDPLLEPPVPQETDPLSAMQETSTTVLISSRRRSSQPLASEPSEVHGLLAELLEEQKRTRVGMASATAAAAAAAAGGAA
ncbi:hypothetical protein BC937DRAFT_94999 [Endogone sp. FLAS-F59071]|nr:hypothetical protein BC937DRAFT_94999 [Endogone sp. FLAS-F59071]|eukprot:RUS20528.1 hypothetical protein BC937DRAFT_94999 [Endogone sp. FLAS-F59071]